MAVPSKYQAKEVLNKVLNAGEDALNVDLSDSVTVTVDSEFPAAAALADDSGNPTTTSVGSHLLGYDSGNTNWNRVEVDDVGHLQIDVVSSALPSGGATAANQATIIGHVDGIETLITSTNSKIDTFDAVLDAIKTDTQEIEEAVETIEGAVSGSEMQVDVVGSLPAGSAAIGKLAANSGVDIGDVDITSIAAGDNNIGNVDIVSLPASTNTIEVVGDAAENANASGNPVLIGGRYDASGTNDGGLRTLGTTDVGALALDPKGVLLTKDFTGQAGSILVTGTGAVAAGYGKFIAIQFIEDTVFSSSANGLSASDVNRWPDDTGAGSDISSNGAAIDGVTFPQGMTIFGRWDDFTLASGKVIAYIGYV